MASILAFALLALAPSLSHAAYTCTATVKSVNPSPYDVAKLWGNVPVGTQFKVAVNNTAKETILTTAMGTKLTTSLIPNMNFVMTANFKSADTDVELPGGVTASADMNLSVDHTFGELYVVFSQSLNSTDLPIRWSIDAQLSDCGFTK